MKSMVKAELRMLCHLGSSLTASSALWLVGSQGSVSVFYRIFPMVTKAVRLLPKTQALKRIKQDSQS